MNSEDLINAVDKILDSYDAFLIDNKYLDRNTHQKEFDLLTEQFKDDEMCMKAINWMKNRYDCYYKKEFEHDEGSAFAFLKNKIKEMKEGKE